MSADNLHDSKIRIDDHSGTATTGHEWDGIEELNTPLPRWWVWTFVATVVWSLAYCVIYPAWPMLRGATEGVIGWHSRTAVVQDLAELQATRAPILAKIKGRCSNRSSKIRNCCPPRAWWVGWLFSTTALLATALARREQRAIRT